MTDDSNVFIAGRSGDTARALLKIADDLGHPARVVRTNIRGYLVPEDVAKGYEEHLNPKPRRAPRKKKAEASAEAETTEAEEAEGGDKE